VFRSAHLSDVRGELGRVPVKSYFRLVPCTHREHVIASTTQSIFSLSNHEIFVVTARHGDKENGQIATWIMPATLVPDKPRILAVFSPRNLTHSLIEQSGRFAMSMLSSDQHELVPLFGLFSGRDVDKFDGLPLERTSGGLPVIPGSCGWAECVILASLDTGDRIVHLAEVVERQMESGRVPLRKSDAFARMPDDIRILLEEKQKHDGELDRELMKPFLSPSRD
jgi:flavin reductase (DIM6/NTAB) family NADH-FMN oxidoreductase RutF